MQKIFDLKSWRDLSDKEKEAELMIWDVYAGEGKDILAAIIKELKCVYEQEKGIISIFDGLYHGGILVICVDLKKGSKVEIPSKYQGFHVMKSYQ